MRFLCYLVAAATIISKCVATSDEQWIAEGGEITDRVPECALNCLAIHVPHFCGSFSNIACTCSNDDLTHALLPCIAEICNVTASLSLQRYKAETCKSSTRHSRHGSDVKPPNMKTGGQENDTTRQWQQFHLFFILPGLASLCVAARIFVRLKFDAGIGADDWMMLAAHVVYLATVGTAVGIAMNDFGQHTYFLTTRKVMEALKLFYISEILYMIAITCTKLSLLLFFIRVFPNKGFRKVTIAVAAFIVVSNFSMLMAITFQCLPFHANWTNWMYKTPPYQCIDVYVAVYFAAGLSILHDVIILLMPLPILWSLNLPWQKRGNLLVMFSVGIFVIICSLLRLPSLMKLQVSSDPSYDQAPIAVWTGLEVGVGVTVGCFPAVRSLIGYLIPSWSMSLNSPARMQGFSDGPYATGGKQSSRSRPRQMAHDRSFIELTHPGPDGDLEGSTQRDDSLELSDVKPYNASNAEGFVPKAAEDLGTRTHIDSKDTEVDGLGRIRGGNNSGILVQTTVYQRNAHPASILESKI